MHCTPVPCSRSVLCGSPGGHYRQYFTCKSESTWRCKVKQKKLLSVQRWLKDSYYNCTKCMYTGRSGIYYHLAASTTTHSSSSSLFVSSSSFSHLLGRASWGTPIFRSVLRGDTHFYVKDNEKNGRTTWKKMTLLWKTFKHQMMIMYLMRRKISSRGNLEQQTLTATNFWASLR